MDGLPVFPERERRTRCGNGSFAAHDAVTGSEDRASGHSSIRKGLRRPGDDQCELMVAEFEEIRVCDLRTRGAGALSATRDQSNSRTGAACSSPTRPATISAWK